MFLKRRLAAFPAVLAALAVGGPAALADAAATVPAANPVITGPSCPDGYDGPTNLATGCPYWLMTYSVQYPGQRPVRCPPTWSPPAAGLGAASTRGAAIGSAGRAVDGCAAVATAK